MDSDLQSLLAKRKYEQALELLLGVYEKRIFRMAVMYLKDPGRAEEVTQDIFLKLWKVLPEYDGRAAMSTWLYTIARNTCLSALRMEKLRRMTPIDCIAEPVMPQSAGGSALLVKMDLLRRIEQLPEMQREVITLFYLQEQSVRDVAQMLDLAEGTVKSYLHRARLALVESAKE